MNRLKLVVVIFVVVLVGILAWFLWPRTNYIEANAQQIGLNNEIAVATRKTDELVFSNERGFVSYNFKNGEVRSFGPEIKLPEIRSLTVSPSGNYFLFFAPAQYFDDTLGSELSKSNQNLNASFWWVYSTLDNSLRYLDPYTSYAVWGDDDNIYALGSEGIVNSIYSYSNPGLNIIRSERCEKYKFLQFSNGKLYGETQNGHVHELDKNGKYASTFSEDTPGIQFNKNASFGFYNKQPKNNDTIGQTEIMLRNVTNNKDREIAKLQESSVVWAPNGNALLYVDSKDSRIHSYDIDNNSRSVLRIPAGGKEELLMESVLVGLGNTSGLFVSHSGDKYLVGDGLAKPPVFPKQYEKKTADNTIITFNDKSGAFFATTEGPVTADKRTAVFKQLADDSINPDFFIIRFKGTESVQNFGR